MYLFDTDVVANIYKKRPSPHLLRRLADVAPEEQHISVLDFDLKAACLAGKIRARLVSAGARLAWADIQIAAIAQSNDLILVAGDCPK